MEKPSKLVIALAVLAVISSASSSAPAYAQSKLGACNQRDKVAVKNHISKQISALARSDWKGAYSYAAQTFQSTIPLDAFKEIITQKYSYLISNNGVSFGGCRIAADAIYQFVNINYRGKKHVLLYALTLVDGRLGIAGASDTSSTLDVAP